MNEANLRAAAGRAARSLGVDPDEAELVLRDALAGLLRAEREASPEAATTDDDRATTPRQGVRWVSPDDRGGSYVRVPFLSKAEHARPLQRVIAYGADKLGMSHYLAVKLATYLFEGVADEVSLGGVVRVPGFGVWGPWLWDGTDGRRAVYPRFVAARPFRLHVRCTAEPGQARNDVLRAFQRSHHPSSRPDKAGSRTWGVMRSWRDDVDRQAGFHVGGDAG
jgi:hypothetical protein